MFGWGLGALALQVQIVQTFFEIKEIVETTLIIDMSPWHKLLKAYLICRILRTRV
jgi:hypothetical protein